ncbi:Complex I intermediate-associated protein 30, mitochondrial [Strongyloides ratti]|uniref:Complex I intermediate-associated protein 30, mitochondrial n=1 Tax=Strongyloides ratti TaxID=34506 RepID=A0A090LQE5_STRRB|nr:Complex I intermediate-associated protein 30, mitochondrial [Strongyloides ratti]CEF69776.1 Complex I intermediate-associated protein 30, mitochondrial [Strongyloides ratti]
MLLSRSSLLFRRLSSSQVPNKSSSLVKNIDSDKGEKIKKYELKAKLEKPKWSLFKDRHTAPTNLSFPNEIGVEGYDPDIPFKDVLESIPRITKSELSKFAEETRSSINIEKVECIESTGILRHGDTNINYQFKEPSDINMWKTGCDSDWGEGFSTCSLKLTDENTALFSGNLSTKLINDGKTERAGWASMKSKDRRSFLRKKYMTRWLNYSHLIIRCRGDGRSYKIMLHTPGKIDLTWGDSYSYPLHTHGGPYWQIEKIPFSRFFHTVYGRIQDKQQKVFRQQISSIEIDFIGVTHDKSHREEFAYETYTLPIWYSDGF